MANLTVSSAVDNMLQGTSNSNIRSRIGAISLTDFLNVSVTFGDEVNFDSTVFFNDETSFDSDTFFNGQAEFTDSVTFQGSTDFEDDALFRSLVEFDSDQGVEFTGGGSIQGVSSISTESLTASSFVKVSPINPSSISSPSNGMIIYNSSTNKFQGRANGVWVDLH